MTTFDERHTRVQEIRDAIESGAIETADGKKLAKYVAWLCDPPMQGEFIGQEYQQVCETVRLQMLRAMMEGFEKRSKFMQRWVMILAFAALIASIVQIAIAYRAEMRAAQEATSKATVVAPKSQ